MTTGLHAEIDENEVHGPYRRIFADSTARLADSNTYVAVDVTHGVKALQADDFSEWILTAITPVWTELTRFAHGITHENGGSDEVNVAGLSGELADPQPPKSHTHVEVDITDLDHTDTDAIHDNVVGEIILISEDATPADGDVVLIEDISSGNAKKRVQLQNLPHNTPNRIEDQFIPTNGQVTFILSSAPTDLDGLIMSINGVAQDRVADFTVSGVTLTYLNTVHSIASSDTVIVTYR